MQDRPYVGLASHGDQAREMRGARCDALSGLDVVDHVETKAAREIGPRVVISDEFGARVRRQHPAPLLSSRSERCEKPFAIGDDAVAMLGRSTCESLGNARRDDDCVLRIKPVVRIANPMRVAALVHHALAAYLE